MKIASINSNNNNQINFKEAYRIKISKAIFPSPISEVEVDAYFKNVLNNAIRENSKSLFEKFMFAFNIKPKAIGFLNYPGYMDIQKYVRNDNKSWFEQNLKTRFNLECSIPEFDKDYYDFYVLDGEEKNKYLKLQNTLPKRADVFVKGVLESIGTSSKNLDKEEKELLTDLGFLESRYGIFKTAIDNNIYEPIFVDDFDSLTNLLSCILQI